MSHSDTTGIVAALLTSVLWAMSSIFFSFGGKQLGSVIVNRIRLIFAVLWLLLTHWIIYGTPLPVNASPERWMWFGLSGIVGLAVGDTFLFQAYVLIGPRISTLFMASVPIISTVLGVIFFHEIPRPLEWAGILVTLSGTLGVLLDGQDQFNGSEGNHNYLRGIGCGILAAIGQAGGMALAKNGLTDGFSPLSGTLMRMVVAMLVIWAITLVTGKIPATLEISSQKPRGLLAVILGSIVGPFLGVWCSLIATQTEILGIASTLTSLTPVFVLPLTYLIYKEKISSRAVIGTLIALLGTALLLLSRADFFAA